MTNLNVHDVAGIEIKLGDYNDHTWTTLTIHRKDNGRKLEPIELVLFHVEDLHLSDIPMNRS